MPKIQINEDIVQAILITLLTIEAETKSFYIVMKYDNQEPEVFIYGSPFLGFMTEQLKSHIQGLEEPGTDFRDYQKSIATVKVGNTVVGCYSTAKQKVKEAIATVYAFFVETEKRYGRLDEEAIDAMLLQIDRWQRKYLPGNDLVLKLAQQTFKSEAIYS